MKCYYEVLEIENGKSATAEEIKKQYRKMALQWHPDKNIGNDEATCRFKDINHAYSILSDPREREWYDDHRNDILNGSRCKSTNESNDEYDEYGPINLWPYFSTRFNSTFYITFQGLFTRLESIESSQDINRENAPLFGDETSSPIEVKHFYAHWSSFISSLSFSSCDMYNTTEADNRLSRRAMEKENKKARDKAKAEYVNTVRNLVQYLKKQDPRYIAIVKEDEKKKNERMIGLANKKKEEIAKRKERKNISDHEFEQERENERARSFLLADCEDSDDDCFDDVYDELSSLNIITDDNEITQDEVKQPEDVKNPRCDICDKSFITLAQLNQHENSKPHRKKAQEFIRESTKGSSKNKGDQLKLKEVKEVIDKRRSI